MNTQNILWKRIGWKVFAVLFTLMQINYWFLYDDPNPNHTLETILAVFNIFGLIGIWGLSFSIPILKRILWKALLLVDVALFISCMLFLRTPGLEQQNAAFVWAIILIPFLPFYVGLYLYGFRSMDIWRTKETEQSGAGYPPQGVGSPDP